ncbi:MAG: phosphonate ABC transporter, permease protein PhnE [Parasulfuritortus sp.]|jgi:phosphonate transport system permease protein|nr:phosphonate ABC transporter, permease protein PhnE [Parasulfuritortus sp.]
MYAEAVTIDAILADGHRRARRSGATAVLAAAVILAAFVYSDALDPKRYRDALPTILTLFGDAVPPDFARWRSWGKPLLDTLAMSVVGTVLGGLTAIPLGALAARGSGPAWLRHPALLLLNTLRSIPGLIWGVLFVAAVGFGPLPGIFALAFHSTGMLGKFYAEILEHMDPAPGNALRSHGVSELGVLRFSVWPQIMPRLMDVTLYRWEHNVRAATTLGMVGCGGIGQEIVVALDQFEYREASALILVLLALVTAIGMLGAGLRVRLLERISS